MDTSEAMSAPVALTADLKGSGYPILCLHGHPGLGGSMSVFTHHLSKRFWTVAPDLRGYGRSRVPHPFAMMDHLLDLEALLERLRIRQCLILGWSLGGILAIELALRHPDRVSGLILIASAARPRGNHPPITWQDYLYTGIVSLINRAAPGWQWNIDTFGRRSLYRYLIQQHTTYAYRHLAAEGMAAYLQTSPQATQALNTAIRTGYNRLADLSQIRCPSLVMAGACDRHITAQSSQETAAHLTNCQFYCYPDTAHLFPWEIPQQLLQDIDQWIETHSVTPQPRSDH